MRTTIITDEEILLINENYGTKANPDDADHYKLCQVIINLEERLREKGEEPRAVDKSGEK